MISCTDDSLEERSLITVTKPGKQIPHSYSFPFFVRSNNWISIELP